jgi:hypothetical protein
MPARAAWGGAGGAEAFERLVDRFYRRVLVEPLLQPLFVSMPTSTFITSRSGSARCSAARPPTAKDAVVTRP